jgi:hypothetical protein
VASSSSTDRFTLSGPSATLDPRFDAFRGDLADVALASLLFAPHYAAPIIRHSSEAASIRERPDSNAVVMGELSKGDAFALLDITGGWGWGYRMSDHRVGYVPAAALSDA